jgi:flagellar FliL protein
MSDPTPVAEVTPSKGKKKLLLIVVAGLVVVLGGGGAAAYFLMRPSGKDGHAAKAEQAERVEPIYVALDPPFVVNFESAGLVRFLQVTVQAMTGDAGTAELIKRHDPMIRNGLLMLFSGQSYDTLKSAAGKEKLRQAALAEVRRVVAAQGGDGAGVESLYFTSFVMQ